MTPSPGNEATGDTAAEQRRAKKVEQVRAMLAKAASTHHEAEAATFEAKALEIMAAYEIEERELREASGFESEEIDLGHMGNAGTGAASLAIGLADLFGGAGVRGVSDRRHYAKLHTTPSQRENVDLMLDHLLPQMRNDLSRDRPRSRKSYSVGWAYRVLDRLRSAQTIVYSQSNALVPTGDAARIDLYAQLSDQGIRVSTASVKVDGRDYERGDAAGEEADLNQARVAG